MIISAVSIDVKQGRLGREGRRGRSLGRPQLDGRGAAGEVHEDHGGRALGHDERADAAAVVARAPHHREEEVVAGRVGQRALASSTFSAAGTRRHFFEKQNHRNLIS